jgi:hypothetical protein
MKKKYTFALPEDLYDELKAQADRHDVSITEVIRKCLKFGLIGLKTSEDSRLKLYIKERIEKLQENGQTVEEDKEAMLQFVW